jgi:hypothetical protein
MEPTTKLVAELERMPRELEQAIAAFSDEALRWKPDEWGGSPGEGFSALEHVCHLRDIEADGYHVRIRRLLEEEAPSLVSIDGSELARQRRYAEADLAAALAAFRAAREQTVARVRGLSDVELQRAGDFAEYGRVTLLSLLHYLRSHDQQHLACLEWLLGKRAAGASVPTMSASK